MGKKKAAARSQPDVPLIKRIPKQPGSSDDVPEDEKFRLMQQAGLMEKVKAREAELAQEQMSTSVFLWQALFLSVPFGFLLGAFDVTVKVQYSEPWTYHELIVRSLKSTPGKSSSSVRDPFLTTA